jgi:aminomethyltransferase
VSENAVDFADLQLTNRSDDYSLLAVQGPKSIETLQKLTTTDLSVIPYYGFAEGTLAGVPMILSRTGYTGEIGFELYFTGDESVAATVVNALFEVGSENGIAWIGLGARDTLRLEKGYCLYGNDITDETNPIEAGLGWITKLAKGTFNGSNVIAAVKEAGPTRKLVGFKMLTEKLIPRSGYPIMHDGAVVGTVTSGNQSPTLGVGIGLGYVPTALSNPGTVVELSARGTTFPAEVVKIPFC